MAFSDDRNHIPRLGVSDAVLDSLPAVRDLHISSACLLNASSDIRDNILRLLVPGVVGGDDAQIRQLSADLSHGVTPVL